MKSSLPKVSVSWKLIFLALFGLYCFSRLYNLVLLPITNDEANYILWAKYTATTNSGWFISLESGKPPIFFWLIVFFIKMLPSSAYLVAGRLASVFSGFLALFGIFKLANLLFRSTRAGFISMILYILCPFTLMYNRLALYDSLLTTTMLWAVYFALRAAKTQKNLAVAGWGISLGLALLVKPTALVFFVLTPIIYLLTVYDRRFLHKLKTYSWQIVLALLIAVGMHSFLVLSSGFYDYITRALDYTSKGSSDLATRLAVIGQNLNFTTDWLAGYLTWPLVLLCLVSLVYLWRKKLAFCFLVIYPLVYYAGGLYHFGPNLFPALLPFCRPVFASSCCLFFGEGLENFRGWQIVSGSYNRSHIFANYQV